MPSPDPDVLAAEDGSPPDDLLYLLYRTGEPRDLSGTVGERREPSSLVDIAPTLVGYLGLSTEGFDGTPLHRV